MKLFTRFTLLLAVLALPLAPAFATAVTAALGAAPTAMAQGPAIGPTDPRLAGLNVFPNPSHGQVTVQLNQKAGILYKLRLSSIIGQELRTIALRPELTSAGLALDLSDLPTGMYFYSLLVDGKVVTTKRLVLQN